MNYAASIDSVLSFLGDLSLSAFDLLTLGLSLVGMLFIAAVVLPTGISQVSAYRDTMFRLARLRRWRTQEQKLNLAAVVNCFGSGPVAREGASYFRSLQAITHQVNPEIPPLGTADPAEKHFSASRLGASLVRDLGYALGMLLTGLSVLASILNALGPALASEPAGQIVGGFYSILAPALVALLIFAVAESLYVAQRRQLAKVCGLLDEILLVPSSVLIAEHLVAAVKTDMTLQRESLTAFLGDVRKVMETGNQEVARVLQARETALVSAAARAVGDSVGTALTEALERPTAKLVRAAERLGTDQGRRVKTLVESVLKEFVKELSALEGEQLGEIKQVLRGAIEVSEQVRTAFAGLPERVEADMADQVQDLGRRIHGAVDGDLRQSVVAIREASSALAQATKELQGAVADVDFSKLKAAPASEARPVATVVRSPADAAHASRQIARVLGELQEETDRLTRVNPRP